MTYNRKVLTKEEFRGLVDDLARFSKTYDKMAMVEMLRQEIVVNYAAAIERAFANRRVADELATEHDALKIRVEELETQLAEREWRPVTESEPADTERVLLHVFCSGATGAMAMYNIATRVGRRLFMDDEGVEFYIDKKCTAHYQPLPAPPGGDEDGT